MLGWLNIFLPPGVACRTGVIFFVVFQGCEGKREVSKERQTRAAEDGAWCVIFPHLTPSRVSRAFRSLRACLRAPEKLQKKMHVCWGPVSPRATNSVNTSNKGLLSAVVKCIFFGAVYFYWLVFLLLLLFLFLLLQLQLLLLLLGSLWARWYIQM